MKLKKEYLILLLIIVALTVYLATRSKNQTHFALPAPPSVESKALNRLLITKTGAAIELTKKDDRWYIEPKGYPADDIKVRNMVKAAADLAITDLISESGNYERYDLTEDKKTHIQAFSDQKQVRDFDIGRTAPTYQHTFARLADDANVYQARGNLTSTFNHTADDLRDLTVLAFDKEKIDALTIAKSGQSLMFSKKELPPEPEKPDTNETPNTEETEAAPEAATEAPPKTQWQDPEGQAADPPSVQRLLNDLSSFKCNSFMDDEAVKTLDAPLWTVTLNNAETPVTFSVFKAQSEDATEYPATSSATPYAFKIAKSKLTPLEKAIDTLLKIEPETKSE